MARVYLGLGTNLGDRASLLREALRRIEDVAEIEAVSGVWRTEPVGYRDQPDFWNLVTRARTDLEPEPLLSALLEIEKALGRVRSFPNAPRPIDIDLLLYDDRRISTPALTVPHPRMLERGFVLRPLAELDPDLRHPVTGEPIAEALSGAQRLERGERILSASDLLEDRDLLEDGDPLGDTGSLEGPGPQGGTGPFEDGDEG